MIKGLISLPLVMLQITETLSMEIKAKYGKAKVQTFISKLHWLAIQDE